MSTVVINLLFVELVSLKADLSDLQAEALSNLDFVFCLKEAVSL